MLRLRFAPAAAPAAIGEAQASAATNNFTRSISPHLPCSTSLAAQPSARAGSGAWPAAASGGSTPAFVTKVSYVYGLGSRLAFRIKPPLAAARRELPTAPRYDRMPFRVSA